MKIITRKSSDVVLYSISDDVEIAVGSDKTVVGNPPRMVIHDCNSGNVNLYEGVADTPEDWVGNKYLYNGSWSANPDWVEPEIIEPELDENSMPIEGEPNA